MRSADFSPPARLLQDTWSHKDIHTYARKLSNSPLSHVSICSPLHLIASYYDNREKSVVSLRPQLWRTKDHDLFCSGNHSLYTWLVNWFHFSRSLLPSAPSVTSYHYTTSITIRHSTKWVLGSKRRWIWILSWSREGWNRKSRICDRRTWASC